MHRDRFDIVEAHYCMEVDYNCRGWLRERPSNQRRMDATHVHLHRMHFRPRPNLTSETLEENGREIYRELERRYGFR